MGSVHFVGRWGFVVYETDDPLVAALPPPMAWAGCDIELVKGVGMLRLEGAGYDSGAGFHRRLAC